MQRLRRLRADWYWLYCQISWEWTTIKDLQNRERIWKTLEFIVRRVDNSDEDVQVVKEEHSRSFPFRSEKWEIVHSILDEQDLYNSGAQTLHPSSQSSELFNF